MNWTNFNEIYGMKKLLLLVILLLPLLSYSQSILTYNSKIIGVTKDNEVLATTFLNNKGYKGGADFILPPKSKVYIIGAKSFKMESGRMFDYYEIAYLGNNYFIYKEDLSLFDNQYNFELLLKDSILKTDSFKKYNISNSDLNRVELEIENIKLKLDVYKFIDLCRPKGLVVISNSVFNESEYTDGKSFSFEVINLSKKKIKYITFNVIGYNAVDDKVIDRGKYLKSIKGVGPINYDDKAYYSFKYVWLTDLVKYAKVVNIKIEYMDGSSKIIDNPNSVTLSLEQYMLYNDVKLK
jgi:hypothetical protein